jgi:Putative metal-binding motif
VRLGTIVAVAALALVVCTAPAHAAFVFDNRWGYAEIAADPFNDPSSGTLLQPSAVFPRGYIRDKIRDGYDVRMYINVFRHGSGYPEAWHSVIEGDFQNKSFDAPMDIRPYQVSYLKYDFCLIHPSTHAVQECEAPLRLGRPPETGPPQPPGGGGGGSTPPPPEDRDGDGVPADRDCDDRNATVWPGGTEIPGNKIDDDCTGGDAAARLTATVKHNWAVLRGRTRVTRLLVREAPAGAAVEVRCLGKRCPFRVKKATVKRNGTAALRRFFRRRLRPGMTIEVRITAPNLIGKVVRYKTRRRSTPDGKTFCLPPGVTKPQRC